MSVHNLRFPLTGDASPRAFTVSARTLLGNCSCFMPSLSFLVRFIATRLRQAARPIGVQLSLLLSSMPRSQPLGAWTCIHSAGTLNQ